jgi:hypothetical protein
MSEASDADDFVGTRVLSQASDRQTARLHRGQHTRAPSTWSKSPIANVQKIVSQTLIDYVELQAS